MLETIIAHRCPNSHRKEVHKTKRYSSSSSIAWQIQNSGIALSKDIGDMPENFTSNFRDIKKTRTIITKSQMTNIIVPFIQYLKPLFGRMIKPVSLYLPSQANHIRQKTAKTENIIL